MALTARAGVQAGAPIRFGVGGALLAFTLYVLGLSAIVAVGWSNGWDIHQSAAVLIAIGIYSGTRLAWEIGRGADRWFLLAFHTFVYIFLAVAPLAQLSAGVLLWAVDPRESNVLSAALSCAAGVIAFDMFALIAASSGPLAGNNSPRAARTRRLTTLKFDDSGESAPDDIFAIRRIVAALSGAAAIGLVVFVAIGGLAAVFASRAQMDAVLCGSAASGDMSGCGTVTALVRVPVALLLVALLGLRGWRGHWWGRFAFVLAVVGTVATANPISAARFWVGAVVIGVIGAISQDRRTTRVLFWITFPLALLVVFPQTDFARGQFWSLDFGFRPQLLFQKQDYDAFQQIMNGITFVSLYGQRDGAQLVTSVLFAIPRTVWLDKSLPTGTLVTSALGVTSNTNVSAPLWEEAYVDFGAAGVLVFLGLTGFIVGRLERYLQSSKGTLSAMTLVAPFLAGYAFFFLRGSLLPAMGMLATSIGLVALLAAVGRRRAAVGRGYAFRSADAQLAERKLGPDVARRPW